jgi:hypothetical protein
VDDPAKEPARVCRHEGFAVVTGADQQTVETLGPRLAIRDNANRPSAIAAERAVLDTRAEADVRRKPERARIVGEVNAQLPPMPPLSS